MLISLKREAPRGKAVFGRLVVDGGMLAMDTLENLTYAIPDGFYRVRMTYSPRFQEVLPILDGVYGYAVQNGSAVVQNGYPALNREYMNEAGEWNLVKLFRSAIASGEVIRAKELETRVMQLTNMVSFKRYNSLREDAVQKGIILRQSLQNGCEYCYATDIQNPQLQLTEIENSDGVESVF